MRILNMSYGLFAYKCACTIYMRYYLFAWLLLFLCHILGGCEVSQVKLSRAPSLIKTNLSIKAAVEGTNAGQ